MNAAVKYDVFVVADLCIDLLFTGKVRPQYGQAEQFVDDYTTELGGSAAIFASQFTKLGGNVGFLASVGDDVFGRILIDKLRSLNIGTRFIKLDPTEKTAVGLGLSDGHDRSMLTYAGTMFGIQPENITSELINQTKHWHIAGYFLLPQLWDFWKPFLQQIQQQGITTSLDTNWAPAGNWSQVREILPLVNVFLPNEAEAMHISGKDNLKAAGYWLAQRCDLVVIKCGAAGAITFEKGRVQTFAIPAELTENLTIADTTGAGDNFDAGFLRAWLLGKPLSECVQLAMKCGTSSLRAIGGIGGQIHAIIT